MVRFHLSLNVSDLTKSVEFYRALFGMEPAKLRHDYAKFEPNDPPLVLSLEPTPRPTGGPLNHLGFRLADGKSLVAMQERLESAGLRSQREEGVECCYAKQTKFWLHDPDGTLWEIYTLDGDIEHRGEGQSEESVLPKAPSKKADPTVYEHRMGDPIPTRIPLESGVADEVRLRGTLNLPIAREIRELFLAEAFRILKPNGRFFVHVLTGDHTVDSPDLPGLASSVRYVPQSDEALKLLEDTGLVKVKLLKFDATPCFVRNQVSMRETQIEGWKPVTSSGDRLVSVVYRGPFKSVMDDYGNHYPLGEKIRIPAEIANQLLSGELAGMFTRFEEPVAELIMLSV